MTVEDIILSPEAVSKVLSMVRKEEYLKNHRYDIYKGKDGKWHTYLPDDSKQTKRRHIKRNTEDEVIDVVVDYYKNLKDSRTFADIFNEWNDRREEIGRVKPSTATRYRQDFERYFGEFGLVKAVDLTPDRVSDFLEEQVAKYSLSAKAFGNLKSLVRGVLKRAKKLKLIAFDVDPIFQDLDISDKDFKKRSVDDSKEIFYDDEFDGLMAWCEDRKSDLSSLGIALMMVSGLRVGEVVCLKKHDILDREVFVHRTETQFKKDGTYQIEVSDYPKTPAGVRRVIIPDAYSWILDRLIQFGGDEWIFTGMHGKRMHTMQIRKRLYSACRALDIPVRSPHKIRKTYGTILLDNHVDSKIIEKQMGHTDVMTTELHYHRDRKRTQQKRDIINSIAEFS